MIILFIKSYKKQTEYVKKQVEKYMNEHNCIIMDTFGTNGIDIYVTYEAFAKKRNPKSTYNSTLKAWYIQTV